MDYLKLAQKKINRETFIENIEPLKKMIIELGLGELDAKKMNIFVINNISKKQAIKEGIHPDNIDTYVEALKIKIFQNFVLFFPYLTLLKFLEMLSIGLDLIMLK